jgi:hypothetical protein
MFWIRCNNRTFSIDEHFILVSLFGFIDFLVIAQIKKHRAEKKRDDFQKNLDFLLEESRARAK